MLNWRSDRQTEKEERLKTMWSWGGQESCSVLVSGGFFPETLKEKVLVG